MSERIFLRISVGVPEWGLYTTHIPVVGDIISLPIGEPDKDPEDSIDAVVIERRWIVDREEGFYDEIYLEAKFLKDQGMPDGWIAHSPEWPSTEYGERQKELDSLRNNYPLPEDNDVK